MTPAEITKELDELELRLERLRIKYDQFFTGIEKVAPWVQRKDVDRRFQQLHREQMRSTTLRFRFNTLVQRFTSYQTYWGRTLRQIEEGTYKRDVIRAQRLGKALDRRAQQRAAQNSEAPAAEAPPDDAAEPVEELSDDDLLEAASVPPSGNAVDEIPDDLFGESEPPEAPTPAPPPPARPAPAVSSPASAAALGDFTIDANTPMPPSSPAVSSPVIPRAPAMPDVGPRRPMISPFGAVRPAVMTPQQGMPAAPSGSLPRVQPAPAQSTPLQPMVARPPLQPAAPVMPTQPTPVQSSPVAPAAPVPRPVARPQPAPAPAQPTPAARDDDPSLRALYQRYVDARRDTGEQGDVRFEAVARQVRETLPKLAEKYQGADVRMEVAIKDGRAVLRPVVTMKKKG